MDRASPPLTIIYQDDALCCAHWHNLQICVFAKAMRMSHVDVWERGYLALARRHADRVLGLTVLLPHSPLAETAVMRRAQESTALLKTKVQHLSIAIELTGVWNTLLKAIFRSLIVVSRLTRGIHMHDSIDSACQTLVPLIKETAGVVVSAADLAQVVQLLRERLRADDAAAAQSPP